MRQGMISERTLERAGRFLCGGRKNSGGVSLYESIGYAGTPYTCLRLTAAWCRRYNTPLAPDAGRRRFLPSEADAGSSRNSSLAGG